MLMMKVTEKREVLDHVEKCEGLSVSSNKKEESIIVLKMTNGTTKIEKINFVKKDPKEGENLTLSIGDGITTLRFNLHTFPDETASKLGYGLRKISDICGKSDYTCNTKWGATEAEEAELKRLMEKL